MMPLTVSALSLLLTSASFAAEQIECEGQTIVDEVYDDNVELSGELCIFANTTVNGNVTINEGAGLIAEGTTIDGNVYGDKAEGLNLRALMGEPTVVTGNVLFDGGSLPGIFLVRGSTVEGNMEVSDWPGFLSVIGGNFEGNVEISGVDQRVQLVDTDVSGNVSLDDNGIVWLVKSNLEGNVEITDTVGLLWFNPGRLLPTQDNVIEGNLDCSGNGKVEVDSLSLNGNASGQCAQ